MNAPGNTAASRRVRQGIEGDACLRAFVRPKAVDCRGAGACLMCMPRATFGHVTTCSGQCIGRNDDSSSAVSMLKMMPMQTAVKRAPLLRRVSTCVAAVCALMLAPVALGQEPTESPIPPSRPPSKPTPPGVTPPPPGPIGRPGDKSGDKLVRMNMTADVPRITPGEKFLLAFAFSIDPHWHIYWENAGASGAPTEIDVKAPPNFVVGKTLFPRPQIIPRPRARRTATRSASCCSWRSRRPRPRCRR